MRKLYLLFLMSLPAWGFSQIYCSSTDLYPDLGYVPTWTSTSGGSVYLPVAGNYRLSISASNSNLPHAKIQVTVNSYVVSTLLGGISSTTGNLFSSNTQGSYPFRVSVLLAPPYAQCASQTINIELFSYYSGKIISQYTVNTSTYSPANIRFKPTALQADHKGFWSHKIVVASQAINIYPGVTITPSGTSERIFKIGSCVVNKTGRTTSELFEQDEYKDDIGLSSLRLMSDPVNEEIRLELINISNEADYELSNLSEMSPLLVFPNPNNGQFNVELNGYSGAINLVVYDVMSKIVYSQNSEENIQKINISDQPKGIYFVKVKVGEKVFNEKIVYQ